MCMCARVCARMGVCARAWGVHVRMGVCAHTWGVHVPMCMCAHGCVCAYMGCARVCMYSGQRGPCTRVHEHSSPVLPSVQESPEDTAGH